MNKKVLIATGNKHKKEKLTWIVKDYFDQIDYIEDLGLDINIDENRKTFIDNASLKAETYSKQYDGYVVASDGGVLIPSLGDQWDPLRTKRFAGESAHDFERVKLLLEMMKEKKGQERTMTWNESIAIAKNGKTLFSKQVQGISGLLQETFDPSKYKQGVWVCSVWFFPQFQKNFFDLTDDEKKEIEGSWQKLYDVTHEYLETNYD